MIGVKSSTWALRAARRINAIFPPSELGPFAGPVEDGERCLRFAAIIESEMMMHMMMHERTQRPKIVCMCGSTKFKQTWIAENARLTGEGFIVLSVGFWGHHERIPPSAEQKRFLDELHLRKIDLCDWVWVLDVGGYCGESTTKEIAYAKEHGKAVRYLSLERPDYVEPADQLQQNCADLREALTTAEYWLDVAVPIGSAMERKVDKVRSSIQAVLSRTAPKEGNINRDEK